MRKPNYSETMIKLRSQAGLTQRQVAEALGVTVQTVSNWETGHRVPRLTFDETLILCKVLSCTLEALVEPENHAEKDK
jgi:transcriptional regulator with XRE-family HTH domain